MLKKKAIISIILSIFILGGGTSVIDYTSMSSHKIKL